MGLIMLILIGAAPTAYALNRTMPDSATPAFVAVGASAAQGVFAAHAGGQAAPCARRRLATIVGDALRDKNAQPARRSLPALRSCRATSPTM